MVLIEGSDDEGSDDRHCALPPRRSLLLEEGF